MSLMVGDEGLEPYTPPKNYHYYIQYHIQNYSNNPTLGRFSTSCAALTS